MLKKIIYPIFFDSYLRKFWLRTFTKKGIVFFVAFLFFALGCSEQKAIVPPKNTKNILDQAKNAYAHKNFKQSAQLFELAIDQVTNSEKLEAELGQFASLLSLGQSISSDIKKWQVDYQYYWNGRSFDPLENISARNVDHLKKQNISHKVLHILNFLIETGNDTGVKNFVAQRTDLKDFIVAKGWFALKNSLYSESQRLFSMIKASGQLEKTRLTGLLLTQILSGKNYGISFADCVDQSTYKLDRQTISFSLDKNSKIVPEVVISDMIFRLGVVAKHSFPIWERGIQFVIQNKNRIPTKIGEHYLQLFSLAKAWKTLTKGDLAKAREIFESITEENTSSQKFEAHLGLAVIYWMEEEDTEEFDKHFFWLKDDFYWLGGKKIKLFSEQKRSKDKWQYYISQQRENIVFFDALCRLGEGRSAHTFLGNLVDETEDPKVISLYEQEEKNIPKDVYAENKIWEKID